MFAKRGSRSDYFFFNFRNGVVAFFIATFYHMSLFGYCVFTSIEKLFEKELLKKTDPIYGLMVNKGDELLSLTYKLIKSGLFVLLILLFGVVLFYLITFIKQTLVMEQNNLKVKKLLGAGDVRVTLEHLTEFLIPFLVGYGTSLSISFYFFKRVFDSSSDFLGLKILKILQVMIQGLGVSLGNLTILLFFIFIFTRIDK